ncbi:MAG: hypothetical protein HOO04_07790 [Phycisphaerae bacterium]|jgi:MYXO-CTERM domain-containing protein|nr:hypothetical protein [Phycisphaerae bacterium]MBT5657446.1 hypothetical protein [Phycisphaerae bacterium]
MTQRRHDMTICSVVAIFAMTAAASANKKERPPLWNNGAPPTFHTNQDGPIGAESPFWTADVSTERPEDKHDGAMTFVGIITRVGFDIQIEHRPIRWNLSPATASKVAASPTPTSGGANSVPAPASLVLLGIAALGRRRRR